MKPGSGHGARPSGPTGEPTTHRLFVYGSLAPGHPNAHVLAGVPGRWEPATVTGTLHGDGWGAAMGYPGIVPGAAGGDVEGAIFSSPYLPLHWGALDAFEGEGYERVMTNARLGDGTSVDVHVYALRTTACHPLRGEAGNA